MATVPKCEDRDRTRRLVRAHATAEPRAQRAPSVARSTQPLYYCDETRPKVAGMTLATRSGHGQAGKTTAKTHRRQGLEKDGRCPATARRGGNWPPVRARIQAAAREESLAGRGPPGSKRLRSGITGGSWGAPPFSS